MDVNSDASPPGMLHRLIKRVDSQMVEYIKGKGFLQVCGNAHIRFIVIFHDFLKDFDNSVLFQKPLS